MTNKPVATTTNGGFHDRRFQAIADYIQVPPYLDKLPKQKFNPLIELRLLWMVLKASRRAKCLLLFSSRGYLKPELLAIILLGFLPRSMRPSIILYGEMFEPNHGLSGFVEKIFMSLVNRAVSLYWVYSTRELTLFPDLWDVEPEKMRFIPYYIDPKRTHSIGSEVTHKDYIFAGGNSHRNYEPLIEVAQKLPEYQFVFATAKQFPSDSIPPNVTVTWPSLEKYIQLMEQASLIILPLCTDLHRTVGLLTLLEAMSLGQVVVAANALGIEDYIEDKKTGLIVDGTPEGYIQAIKWILTPKNADHLSAMRKNAQETVIEKFTTDGLVDRLLPIIYEALEIKENWSKKRDLSRTN